MGPFAAPYLRRFEPDRGPAFAGWAKRRSTSSLVRSLPTDTATSFARSQADYGRNAIGAALLDGKRLIETNAFDGWRKVIDFSGDSPNSFSGPAISEARDAVVASGITINALLILCRFCDTAARFPDLAQIYEERIIGGRGAFVVTAYSEKDLVEAIVRKLVLEISETTPSQKVAANIGIMPDTL